MYTRDEDFTAKLMNDMDPGLLDFVKTKVNSFIKWDMVRFFHENPHTADSTDNIARYVGRGVEAVKPELDELVQGGVMEMRIVDGIPVYSLTQDEALHELMDRFVTACEDRHFRVKAVYHIIRGMR